MKASPAGAKKPPVVPAASATAGLPASATAFSAKYCSPCHSGKAPMAGFDVRAGASAAAFRAAAARWALAADRVEARSMPPAGAKQPTVSERAAWVRTVRAALPPMPADPGRVTLRRLNRAEYNNTVRDLFYGLPFSPADDFPSDDVGNGFDNIGDVLSISPLLLERYLDAAETVARKAISIPRQEGKRFDAAELGVSGGARVDDLVHMYSVAQAFATMNLETAGRYRVVVRAFETPAGPERSRMQLRVDGRLAAEWEVKAVGEPAAYEAPVELESGSHRFEVSFVNDFYNPNDPNPRNRDRNLHIQSVEVAGPLGGERKTTLAHRRIVVALPEGKDWLPAARQVLGPFARRAFRRPVSAAEVDRFAQLALLAQKDGEPFERGIQIGIAAILSSPHFLFKVEADPPAGDPKGVRRLSAHELATRLSYFLWSSMPDDALFRAAETGALLQPPVLAAQTKRMLADEKASALTENFAGQWLQLRKLDTVSPDPELFPAWNEALRTAIRRETELLFEHVLRDNRPVTELLDSDYTFLNEELADHYGITGVSGPEFRRVALADRRRGGLLTQASILAVTSNPNRTSPVKRGKWVLEQILGAPPPPPPPGVDSIEGDTDKVPAKSIKERMERHRRDPACAQCHLKMDTLGFAFENYDPIGRWRDRDGQFTIDSSGAIPEGKFSDLSGLRRILAGQRKPFLRTLSEKLLVYATGRGLEPADRPTVDSIVEAGAKGGYRMASVIQAIVASDAFQKRRREAKPSNVQYSRAGTR